MDPDRPRHLELDRERGLTVTWPDGVTNFFSVGLLRRMSPSAESRQLREEMARNPLTVLPSRPPDAGPLRAVDAELVGNYAIRIRFSDGHSTGLYSWKYLREIAPEPEANSSPSSGSAVNTNREWPPRDG